MSIVCVYIYTNTEKIWQVSKYSLPLCRVCWLWRRRVWSGGIPSPMNNYCLNCFKQMLMGNSGQFFYRFKYRGCKRERERVRCKREVLYGHIVGSSSSRYLNQIAKRRMRANAMETQFSSIPGTGWPTYYVPTSL